MAQHHKVVWYEGMNLDPHHFQQADRSHQATLNFRIHALVRYDWGFFELKINKEALAQGQFGLEKCQGVSPDGLVFDMPGADRLPKARAIAEFFPPTAAKLDVFLAIRTERATGSNCQLEDSPKGAADSRFVMESRDLTDDNSGANPRQIGLARPNFMLRMAGEPLDEFSALKIAEVVRTPAGTFALSDSFIPPCLSIGASENLLREVNDLFGKLVAISNEQRAQLPFGKTEVAVPDLTSLWLAQTINTVIPLLKHRLETIKCHPEALYADLLALAGQLTTYPTDLGIMPTAFQVYEHENLTRCFNQLCDQIQEILKRIRPSTPVVPITLNKKGEYLWFSASIDEKLLQTAQFYLGASGDVDERKLADELPRKLKIATPEGIHALAQAAALGLTVVYTPRPPAGLSNQPVHCFQLQKTGFFWEAIGKSRAVGILVPAEFMKLDLKLWAVKPA
ncbi:MAG: type VI secretion system baseplate subunit TssK [bacterium]